MTGEHYFKLQTIIASIIADQGVDKNVLQKSAQSLSRAYRQYQYDHALSDFNSVVSYLAARLPATYNVIATVLQKIDDDTVQSQLDIGSGPGTAVWAGVDRWPMLQHVTAIERNNHMLVLARQIQRYLTPTLDISWQQHDTNLVMNLPNADIVTMNYSLGELNQAKITVLLNRVFSVAQKYLIIVEPGTVHGFNVINHARNLLLDQGGYIMAPCTHHQACPLDKNDWCHFSQRVDRTLLHRQAKQAELSYEDEKYSYLIVSKQPLNSQLASRIIKKPLQRTGHVRLDLCNQEGISKKTYSRKNNDVYSEARRVLWGDLWNDI